MKKLLVFCLSFVILFSFQLNHAYAASTLEETVDELLGVKYQWGGETVNGFDCSGFTMYVFKQFGIELPHYSRGQASEGTVVAKNGLKAGDLVFFNTNGRGISHVGIYLGNDEFIHAASTTGVAKNKLSETYYAKRYVTAVRILSEADYTRLTAEQETNIEIRTIIKVK